MVAQLRLEHGKARIGGVVAAVRARRDALAQDRLVAFERGDGELDAGLAGERREEVALPAAQEGPVDDCAESCGEDCARDYAGRMTRGRSSAASGS